MASSAERHPSTAVERVAHFVSSTTARELPEVVRSFAKERLLDLVIALFVAPENTINDPALRLASGSGGGTGSTYWLSGGRGPSSSCAFVNCVLAHSSNHDDGGQGGHPGATVIPAAVALAEEQALDGAELIRAIGLGYEAQVRLASPAAGEFSHTVGDRGLRGTTVTGAFGAAVASAVMMGLDEDETAQALAFSVSLGVPGIEEPIIRGTHERCLQQAENVRMGMLAAELARAGMRAAPSALDGVSGFYSAYTGQASVPPGLLAGIGESWQAPEKVYSRPYPTAGWNTGPVFALTTLLAEHRVDPEDVERVDVYHTWWRRNIGYIDPGPFPRLDQALISCPFALAATLVHGRYDWAVVNRALGDPRVDALAKRVWIDGIPTWGYAAGEVTLVMRDGTRHTLSTEEMPPALVRPRWDDLVRKLEMSCPAISVERRSAIVDEIAQLGERPGVSGLTRLLTFARDGEAGFRA